MKTPKTPRQTLWIVLVASIAIVLSGCLGASPGDGSEGPRDEEKTSLPEINSGGEGSEPYEFTSLGSDLYFNANDGSGPELWRFDGQTAESVTSEWGEYDYGPGYMIAFNDGLYFEAENASGDYAPHEYKGGVVTELGGGAYEYFGDPVIYENKIYFGSSSSSTGDELFSFDGASISEAADVQPGVGSSFVSELYVHDGAIFFSAQVSGYGTELYRYTPSGGAILSGYILGDNLGTDLVPRSLQTYNGTLYYAARFNGPDGPTSEDYELWYYDPSRGNASLRAQKVDQVNDSGDGDVDNLTVFDGNLYFTGSEGFSSQFIYKYDGTDITKLEIVTSDGSGYDPDELTVYDGALYFSADNPANGNELWRYDGSQAELVWDIVPGSDSSSPWYLYVHDGRLFFSAETDASGRELYYYQTAKP
jgi:ELWxxDGT repeat protein